MQKNHICNRDWLGIMGHPVYSSLGEETRSHSFRALHVPLSRVLIVGNVIYDAKRRGAWLARFWNGNAVGRYIETERGFTTFPLETP